MMITMKRKKKKMNKKWKKILKMKDLVKKQNKKKNIQAQVKQNKNNYKHQAFIHLCDK